MFTDDQWIDITIRGFVLTTLATVWVVVLVRINGLRSFSKMTNFDFVMTVAVGSLLASGSQSTTWPQFAQACIAMATLFFVQYATARLRRFSDRFEATMQNTPTILMRDGEFMEEAMQATRVARDDLIAKLREANALDISRVRAVILETTGDISVLHGERLDERLLSGTKRI